MTQVLSLSLSSQLITEILDMLKKELLIFLEYLNVVKLWIQLNVPRIEDGNNFGVGIQVKERRAKPPQTSNKIAFPFQLYDIIVNFRSLVVSSFFSFFLKYICFWFLKEEVLNELSRAEDAAFNEIDTMTKYYTTRSRLIAKVRDLDSPLSLSLPLFLSFSLSLSPSPSLSLSLTFYSSSLCIFVFHLLTLILWLSGRNVLS
jgi:hypothetical protein